MDATVRPAVWFRTARVHQWSKNALIFVPLLVGHAYGSLANLATAAAGFVLVCLLASAAYMLNDVADLEADRQPHVKRLHPFASGELPVALGLVATPLLIAASLVGALLLSPAFAASPLLYLLLTLA